MIGRVVSIAVLALIVFIAIGLTISLVVRWRSNADRARCLDNLRHIGQQYLMREAEATKAFPIGTVVTSEPPDRRLSWIVPGLTALGRQDLFGQIQIKEPWNSPANETASKTFLARLVCPSVIDAPTGGPGPFTYPGIAGVGPEAPFRPANERGAGVFRYDSPTPLAAIKDGLSYTLLLLETSDKPGPWIAGGRPTVRPLDPVNSPYLGIGRPFGGAHPFGANALFADGSGRFIGDNISPSVLEQHASIANSEHSANSQ